MTERQETKPRPIRLFPADRHAKYPMAEFLADWSATSTGRTGSRLQYRTSGCGCGYLGYWSLDAAMLDECGPVPFTSRGGVIRWRWWHSVLGSARFTVFYDDLPGQGGSR
jgi:hypothetical protein